jgi:putative SOS response-associated peptidase YedK
MCGRFTLRRPLKAITEAFGLGQAPDWAPRYNLAPTQNVLVLRQQEGQAGREGVLMRWGLIPSWADDKGIGASLINARAETVSSKPAFRAAFQRRRCLVPADGFYEWKPEDGKRQPYFFTRSDDGLFAFAGLWEVWQKDGQRLETVSILTTAANEVVRPVHDRMPVILPQGAEALWLGPQSGDAAGLAELLRPFPADEMRSRPVSTAVNSAKNEGPACIEPAGPLQRALF